MTHSSPHLERDTEFIAHIEAFEPGELASLRRAAGDRLSQRTDLLWMFGFLPTWRSPEIPFLVATLLAQFSTLKITNGSHRGEGNFGRTWRQAIGKDLGKDHSKSIERRFGILLDSDLTADGGGDLPYRLRQMVRYAMGRGIGLDWPQLLYDLSQWSHPDHYVQRKWAQSFYTPQLDEKDPKQENSDAH